jgi:hypothetical protein
MSHHKIPKAEDPQAPDDGTATDGQDTEGHNLWINPSAGREMTRGRNADIERQVRERQREKEAQKKR